MAGRKMSQGQKRRLQQRIVQAEVNARAEFERQMLSDGPSPHPSPVPQGEWIKPVLLVSENNGFLVTNWRQGWRWFSNLALGSIVAINSVPMPPELLHALPPDTQSKVTIGLAVLGIVGRLINQSKHPLPPSQDGVLHDD
jgi:hypothetical protein